MSPKLPAPELKQVLESAARLQQLMPDAVLVCGSAAAWHTCKGIQPPWDSWASVRAALAGLAAAMVGGD
jgi:hypothetical protein